MGRMNHSELQLFEISDEAPPALPKLKEVGADLVHWWHSIEESKTIVLRKLAEVVVEIRSNFYDEETMQPDWRGKSWEYRQFMSELYESAGVPPASVAGVQSSLRYHVGNRLREVVPTDQLIRAGLLEESPKERMERQHNEATMILRLLDPKHVIAGVEARRAAYRSIVDTTERLSERLGTIPVSALTKTQAREALDHATGLLKRWDEITDELKGRLKA